MPFGEPPIETLLLFKGIKSATLSVGASDTQDTSGCDYICDGTCDEVEINQAIAALPSLGGLVYLCEGTYNVCGPIIIDKDNVTILGAGANTVIRVRDGHNANLDIVYALNHTNLLIKDLRIDGNRANQTAGVMRGVYFGAVTHSKIAKCWFEDVYGAGGAGGGQGIYLIGSAHNVVSENTFDGNDASGIFIFTGCTYNTICNNTSVGNDLVGIRLAAGCPFNTVTGNTVQGNGTHGISIEGFGSSNHNAVIGNTVINNGLLADATYDGIFVWDSDYNDIQGNTIRTTVGAPPPNRQRYGINVSDAGSNGNLVANNDLHQSGITGYYNDAGTDTRGTFTGEVSPTGNTLVVAASNSLDPVRADFYCDNVSDETEINAAITALGATGGTVKLLEGTFTVDGAINLASNVALVGQGAGTVITIPDGHDVNINIIYATGRTQVLIKDLRVDGNRANQAAGAMYGIHFNDVSHSKVLDCWVEEMYGGDGIRLVESNHNHIRGNSSRSNDCGIYILGAPDISEHNIVEGNTVHENGQHGIVLGTTARENIVSDNEIIDNGQAVTVTYDGIFLDAADRNNIHGNTIRSTTVNRHRYGINVSNAACEDNIVKDNDLTNSGLTGYFNDVGLRTKLSSIMVPIFDDSDANVTLSSVGDHVALELANNQDTHVRFNFRVPSDFHQLVRARIVVVSPLEDGDLYWGVETEWGECDEIYGASNDAIALHAEAVVMPVLECLDINAALDGITAGDHVGVNFQRDAANVLDTVEDIVSVLQFWMEYV